MEDMIPWQLFAAVQDCYDLEDSVADKLVCKYKTYPMTKAKTHVSV
jgi:hypothetical protein